MVNTPTISEALPSTHPAPPPQGGHQQTEGDPSFLTILSLNTMKLGDLAGLHSLVRELHPDLLFLQEVNLKEPDLQAVASSLGYKAYRSQQAQPRRTIAILARHEVTVTDVRPGMMQRMCIGGLSLLHVHAPSGTTNYMERELLFKEARGIISSSSIPPMLVGDFNCVLDRYDTELWDPHKFSRELASIQTSFGYKDAYRVLHPCEKRFSWHKAGKAASRLDRLYLPEVFEATPRMARYIPTTSDHSAFLLKLEAAALGLRMQPEARGRSFYWKFNSSLLQQEDFLPSFRRTWDQLEATAEDHPGGPAGWWEETAKPGMVSFCKFFAGMVAGRRKLTRRLFTRSLEIALEAGNWQEAEAAKCGLKKMDLEEAAGLGVRAKQPLLEGEVPGLYHLAAEGKSGASPGLEAVKRPDGTILTDPGEVEQEVSAYFKALFHGRHRASEERPEPFDSGSPFQEDFSRVGQFLEDLPQLEEEERERLEAPFLLSELEAAIQKAETGKSPGLDGLPYEFFKATLGLIGPRMLAALNSMLEVEELPFSLRRGVVRLLPKVAGIPMASQLRPITLLSVDYKILTKMLVARLVKALPSVLKATQLCSVEGRSIFDGAASILSTVEFLQRSKQPGFLVSLDFFHAYDRVSLVWVDRVLEAMGFGQGLRRWIKTLHKGALATFMLHNLTRDLEILFSIRQGDPLAMILYIIQLEPLLHFLQKALRGLRVGTIREASLGYVDDVAALGDDVEDLPVLDLAVRDFEAASGAILNRNRKSMIMGLGAWATRTTWPLTWLHVTPQIKIYGVTIRPELDSTVEESWLSTIRGLQSTLNLWSTRCLPTLLLRRQALEVFALSKIWYLAQILPLPQKHLTSILAALRTFLWKGCLERLALKELHRPLSEGGLGLVCVQTRAKALLAKQACHRIASGGKSYQHLAYWIGVGLLPNLAPGPHVDIPPQHWRDLAKLLKEVFAMDGVDTQQLEEVTSKDLYKQWMTDPPVPKVQSRIPDLSWARIWTRLSWAGLPALLVDTGFRALHNILPLEVRRHRLKLAPSPACSWCGAEREDTLHFFTICPRVEEVWTFLASAAAAAAGGPIPDQKLLYLDLPLGRAEGPITLTILAYMEWAWSTRGSPAALTTSGLLSKARSYQWSFPSLFPAPQLPLLPPPGPTPSPPRPPDSGPAGLV